MKEVAGKTKDLREAKVYTQDELAGVSADDYKFSEKVEGLKILK